MLIRLLRREFGRVKLYFAKMVYVCVVEAIKILCLWQSNFEKVGVFVCWLSTTGYTCKPYFVRGRGSRVKSYALFCEINKCGVTATKGLTCGSGGLGVVQ